ncbi:MAG: carbohydrate ABC transporter permease [Planctomycetota bacterium]|jgi:multiple sugar transport system permease protein
MSGGERTLGYLFLVPALLIVGVFVLYPVASAFVTSLHVDTPFAAKRFVGIENYEKLLEDDVALDTLSFTFLFVGVSTALEILIGLVMALAIHHAFAGRGLVRAAVLVPWAIPSVVAAVMWRYMVNDQYGLANLVLFGSDLESYRAWLAEPVTARAAIIAADVWKTSAFAALLILAGLQSIPAEIHEAARVDGAGPFRRFLSITLPLLRPAILLAFLFRVLDAFRVFDLVYVMTQGAPGDRTNVLSFYGYRKMFPEQQYGYGSAVSVLVFLILAAIAIPTVRLLTRRAVTE